MLKLSRIAAILLVSVFALTVSACGGSSQPSLIKPTVNYIPSGWSFNGERSPEKANSFIGSIYYVNADTRSKVTIDYESIPFWYTQDCQICSKGNILGHMTWLLGQGTGTDKKSGTMTVSGQDAAYSKQTWAGTSGDLTLMYIGFIKDNTYFEITIYYCASKAYDCDPNAYNGALDIINSITF